jgi:hypothetical protein
MYVCAHVLWYVFCIIHLFITLFLCRSIS